jgi:hypothetical protein
MSALRMATKEAAARVQDNITEQKVALELPPFHEHPIVLAEGIRSAKTTPQAALSGAVS